MLLFLIEALDELYFFYRNFVSIVNFIESSILYEEFRKRYTESLGNLFKGRNTWISFAILYTAILSRSHIFYNHLNLVDSIVYDDARKYEFTYDATGSLLQKRIYLDADTRIEKHDYINGIEYINGDIESIYTPEGRIVNDDYFPDTLYVVDSIHGIQEYAADLVISNGSVKDHPNTTEIEMIGEDAVVMLPGFKVESVSEFIADIQNNSSTGWRAEYTVSDHLGNTRLVYSDLNGDQQILPDEIIQENHYYPYGLRQNGDWQLSKDPIAYGYNGMELLDEFGLDLNMTTYRMLDPSIGRWFGVDVDAEKFPHLSGYNSMLNSPITLNDPNGDNPLLIGAAIGLVSNGIQNVSNGDGFFKGGFQAAFMGAWGGGVSAGIGANVGNEFLRAGTHALSNGAQSVGTGGNFWQGAASGGLSSGVGSVMGTSLGKAGQYVQGALTGGFGSSIAGGDFWEGAGQGLITAGLNHAAHGAFQGRPVDQPTKKQIQNAQYELSIAMRAGNITEGEYWLMQEVLEHRISGNNISGIAKQSALNHKWEIAGLASGGLLSIASRSSKLGTWLFKSKSFGNQSKLFGRWYPKFLPNDVKGIFNKGKVRIGWSVHNGRQVFRAAAGKSGTFNKLDILKGPKF